jgi:hypothetical protein
VPIISQNWDYNGFEAKASRLGLNTLVAEATATLTRWQLLVEERKHANGTKWIREMIDAGFAQTTDWVKVAVGGVDWTKQGANRQTAGVEVQVSGRSDMLAVDIMHLKDQLDAGLIDIGIIIVPDNPLSRFLTDRTPNLATARKHVEHRARDLPIRILAFMHDGAGPALGKMRTNLGTPR